MKKLSQAEFLKWFDVAVPEGSKLVFDCDGTLVWGDVGSVAAIAVLKSGLAQPDRIHPAWTPEVVANATYESFDQLRHELSKKHGYESMYEWESLLHAGLTPMLAQKIAAQALNDALEKKQIYRLEVTSEIARKRVKDSIVVSGSPDVAVKPFCRTLGFSDDQIIATVLEEIDGIMQPYYGPQGIVWAEKKKEILVEMNHQPDVVFGDSQGDWAMMTLAKKFRWAVLWPVRHGPGATLRTLLTEELAKDGHTIPTEAGLYVLEKERWILEVR